MHKPGHRGPAKSWLGGELAGRRHLRACGKGTKIVLVPLPPAVGRAIDRAVASRGWTLVLNPDGTTTAWNKDRTKILHSHGPPARAG